MKVVGTILTAIAWGAAVAYAFRVQSAIPLIGLLIVAVWIEIAKEG